MNRIIFRLFVFSLFLFPVSKLTAQQPALLVSTLFANPAGTDDNKEFVELTATASIDFTVTPYTVVFNDGSNATAANGWKTGGSGSYAIEINTGTIAAGEKLYVGGNAFVINGSSCKLKQKNTTGTGGDGGIGTGNAAGILGNGGSNADGVGIFNMAASAITNTSVPIDAIFFGTAVGNATGKFTVPTCDHYDNAQGKFGAGTNTFVAPDPGSDQYITATGEFNPVSFTWITARTWSLSSTIPNCNNASGITLTVPNNLSFTVNSSLTSSYLLPPNISAVVGDATDPAAVLGIVFSVKDNGVDIPAASYTISGSSSNNSVVTDANITTVKSDGSATVKINPTGVGYSTITLTLNKAGLTKTYIVSYAASAAGANSNATTHYHTSNSDASTAIALDEDNMIVSDDEQNRLIVFNRKNSGLPLKSFDYSGLLNLTDLSGGIPREIDLEASAKGITNSNRIFWLGSMSNKSSAAPYVTRPNRNRIFATDVTGTGAATNFTYVGDYENLRNSIISWGDANGFDLTSSAADGKDPKVIDGFNAEGLCFAPDNTTLYVAFRAPLLPVSNRTKALIAPILNFEGWFGNGSPAAAPTFGTPILLDLNGWGIRSIDKLSNNKYVIIAGNYDDGPFSGAIFTWNGNAVDAPVMQSGFVLTGMNPEGFLEINTGGVMSTNQLQLISDNGGMVYYNDGIEAKDLGVNNFKKFRSDIVTSIGNPLPVVFTAFDLHVIQSNNVYLQWSCAGIDEVAYFEIQRAQAGGSYATVSIANPTMSADYVYMDKGLAAGNYEYRIKVVNKNGKLYYSTVRLAKINGHSNYVTVYPNPVVNDQLHISTVGSDKKYIVIRDASGKLVYENYFTGQQINIAVASWAKGIYLLKVEGKDFVETIKLLK